MIPNGYCQCGCGERTNLAPKTSTRNGWVQGEPVRYRLGHHTRVNYGFKVVDAGFTTPCRVWQGRTMKGRIGYGTTVVNGRARLVHGVEWERINGPVLEGLVLDHLCRNPLCAEVTHLEPVTNAENCRRGAGAKLTHADVAKIRKLFGAATYREIAKRFGVCEDAIANIKRGRSWVGVGE